jgi:hypothetical protein
MTISMSRFESSNDEVRILGRVVLVDSILLLNHCHRRLLEFMVGFETKPSNKLIQSPKCSGIGSGGDLGGMARRDHSSFLKHRMT